MSLIISSLLANIASLIIYIPDRLKNDLTLPLMSKDKKTIKEAE
jgi:hypothetical protein